MNELILSVNTIDERRMYKSTMNNYLFAMRKFSSSENLKNGGGICREHCNAHLYKGMIFLVLHAIGCIISND